LQAPPAPPPFIASVGGVAVIYQLGPRLNAMRVKTLHSLKSPVCSCVSITFASVIMNANHGIV
jgi:hypothetical protein